MSAFIKKLWAYLSVKVFNRIDERVWKFDTDNPTTLFEQDDRHLIPTYYPGREVAKLKDNDPEDKFLIEQFASYVYKFEKPVIVEPVQGWVITGKFTLFRKSFPYIEDPWDRPMPKPSIVNFLAPKKVVKIDSAISIRYLWQSYYHFFIDTLSQIDIADKYIPKDVPILVPYYFGNFRYIHDFIKESDFLQGRKIIVQEKDEYYEVKNLYLCKDVFYSDSIFNVVDSIRQLADKRETANRKIFLTRGKHRTRTIRNIEEIEQVVKSFGYEVADPDNMKFDQQIKLFSEAGSIVGLHGAGLTNFIFRKGRPLKVLEIFPGNLHPSHYHNLSLKFNYAYDSISGCAMENSSFYLDPEQLRKKNGSIRAYFSSSAICTLIFIISRTASAIDLAS